MPRDGHPQTRRAGRSTSSVFTRGPLARRSTIPAFHQTPPPRETSKQQSQSAETAQAGGSGSGGAGQRIYHPSSDTPSVTRMSSLPMEHTTSDPLPTFPTPVTGSGSGADPAPYAEVPLLRTTYRSPNQMSLAATTAQETAQAATQRTNRFHRLHRFNRLPLTPRSRSPITFTFSGEPSEYFALWRGRRVRLPGPIPWPCDSLELERVEAQHWLTRLLLGLPFLGPVTEVLKDRPDGRVLDVGTGVGVWAMDVAEMFPWVEVIGCDNVPIQERETCQNVEWDIVDLEDLPYDSNSFDVVHVRFSCLRTPSFRMLLKNAWRLVREGGVLLIFDNSSPPILSTGKTPTGAQAWTDAFHRSLQNAGMAPFKVDDVIHMFSNEELVGNDMRVPIGHGDGRMGQLGKIHFINTQAFLEASRLVMVEYGGYSDSEVDVLCAAYLTDAKEHSLYTRSVTYHDQDVYI